MGKCVRKKTKKYPKWIFVVLGLLILAAFLVLFVMPRVLYERSAESETDDFMQTTASQNQSLEAQVSVEENGAGQEQGNAVEFPVSLVEGNIEIESLFQFSGVNPDAEKQKSTDVASIVLRNVSDKYLSEATVTATLGNGSDLTFVVNHIPAGAAVMAFSIENESLLSSDVCVDITAEAVFEDVPNNNSLEISVEGLTVTLNNTSSDDLNEINVYYRDVFNDKYFGGMTYIYTIEHLPAGESTTITAEESLLGVIEVVRVAVNDKK